LRDHELTEQDQDSQVTPAANAARAPKATISKASRPVRSNMMTTPMATIAQIRM
jgi:hypothetical protein